MKKKFIIPIIIAAVLALVLFLPIPRGTYDDGGTREYDALTFKLVVWNKIVDTMDENGEPMPHTTYRKTSVFWYPHNKKTIDELWKMEIGKTSQNSAGAESPIAEQPIGTDIENIVDLAKSGELATADALEGFYSDGTYDYYFSSIKSQYIIVHYKDGTEQNVKDALAEGKIKISDLDSFGIKYYKEPLSTTTNDWGITLEAQNVTPSGLTLVCYQSGGENVAELNTGRYFVVQRLEDGGWADVEYLPSEYEISWDLVALIIERESTTTWDINWEFLYGELPAGEYRIGKEITNFRGPGDYDKEMIYAGFEIK